MSPAELLVVAVVAVALSVLQTFPLIAHLGSSMPKDLGDPLYQAWQVAWDGHALLHQPGHFWQANHSYPLPDSLAFSDALVGYTPAGLIGSGLHAAIVRYNLLFIFIFALSFFGGWLLARELNASKAGAWVGGAAFAYSPWHFGQGGHMHVLSNGGIALALFLLIRGYRRESWKLVLAGWLAAAWQLSIGFSLGLQLILALAALAAAGVVGWVRSGRPRPAGATVISSALGIAAFGLTAALLSGPYLRVMHDYPSSVRGVAVLERTSPNLGAFFAAPATNMVWGDLTAPLRHSFAHFESEKALFPGIMILLIAMAGLGYSLWPRKLRAGLGISVLVLAVLALGIHGGALGKLLPYRLLFEFVPGWKGVRTPGRLFDLASLALAMLAAGGATRITSAIGERSGGRRSAAVATLLTVLVCLEGAAFVYPHPIVPDPPRALAALGGPRIEIPSRELDNDLYTLWSVDGFPKIVNGSGAFSLLVLHRAQRDAGHVPAAGSVYRLRALGVRFVVVHLDRLNPGLRAAYTDAKPLPHVLGVRRRRVGDMVVFDLGTRHPTRLPPLAARHEG